MRFKIKVASLVVRNKQSSLFCRSVKYEETKLYNIDTSLTFISATVVKIVDSLSEYFSGSNRRVSAKVFKKMSIIGITILEQTGGLYGKLLFDRVKRWFLEFVLASLGHSTQVETIQF